MRKIAAVLLGLAISTGHAASAQPPARARQELPEDLTLSRALQLLQQQSPLARAARARIDVAAAERYRAGVYPNPTLSYGGVVLARGVNTGASWQHQIVLEQPLAIFGQIAAREDLASLSLRAERHAVASDLTDRAQLVRQAFVALLARQERVRVLEESMHDLARVEGVVRGRYDAGDRSVYDVARLELEVAALRIELRNAQTAIADASGQLAALLGFPGWRPRASGSLEPANLPTSTDLLWKTAEARRPSLQAARARVAAARGGLALARRERLPVPAVALGTLLTQDEDSQSVFFGLSFPLPLFDRGQGDISRATAEIKAASLILEAALAETRAEIDRARTVFAVQQETLREVQTQMVERVPSIRRMAEESYRGGSSEILELLDALRSVRAIRLGHLDQQEAVKLAEATLIAAVGLDPAALSRSTGQ